MASFLLGFKIHSLLPSPFPLYVELNMFEFSRELLYTLLRLRVLSLATLVIHGLRQFLQPCKVDNFVHLCMINREGGLVTFNKIC